MGGALKAVSKLAGPIMQMASMFTPLGPIMQAVNTAMSFAKTLTGALKNIAPKFMEKLDKKLDKAQDFAQKAVGAANQFLNGAAQTAQQVGNIQVPQINIQLAAQ